MSSESESETIDFYSDITENGVEGGDEIEGGDALLNITKFGWGVVVVCMMVLILGITMWQLESNSIISYKNPSSTTAQWLSKGLMIAGGVSLGLALASNLGLFGYIKSKPSANIAKKNN